MHGMMLYNPLVWMYVVGPGTGRRFFSTSGDVRQVLQARLGERLATAWSAERFRWAKAVVMTRWEVDGSHGRFVGNVEAQDMFDCSRALLKEANISQ